VVVLKEGETIQSIFEGLGGRYNQGHVLFVDNKENPTLQRDAAEKGPGLLLLEGPYALTLDKVVARILAAGGQLGDTRIRGLSLIDGVFVFFPTLPIDYMKRLKEFYLTEGQVAHAA
jgi:hypothetical protein